MSDQPALFNPARVFEHIKVAPQTGPLETFTLDLEPEEWFAVLLHLSDLLHSPYPAFAPNTLTNRLYTIACYTDPGKPLELDTDQFLELRRVLSQGAVPSVLWRTEVLFEAYVEAIR